MFVVVSQPREIPRQSGTSFALRRDNWNDYGFNTLYQLYKISSQGDPDLIGDVKILKKGQKASDTLQLPLGPLERLDDSFCSVGQDYDYYERLAGLAPGTRDSVLTALRDIIRFPQLRAEFSQEEGWSTSLFRYLREDQDFFTLAQVLLERDYSALPSEDLQFQFHPTGWDAPVSFDFTPIPQVGGGPPSWPKPRVPTHPLPSRAIAVIGRNGSGKSTLLAKLARIAFASRSARDAKEYQRIGAITPSGLGFTRVVTISYSAFDSFEVPGISRQERLQLVKELEESSGRYVFCGLRDIAAEERDVEGEQETSGDRRPNTRLKQLSVLADEFSKLIGLLSESSRFEEFARAVAPLLQEPSFASYGHTTVAGLLTDDPRTAFLSWSTGHKIVMHVAASLAAHIQSRSLVLFDEPETHLHPPLLAALMHALRNLLAARHAFAIIATHSPVVLQETLARHVLVVRRSGDTVVTETASLETFGENTGTITHEIFGLSSEATDYHLQLDELIAAYKTLDAIEERFDQGLSHQARAYVMSKLATDGGL